ADAIADERDEALAAFEFFAAFESNAEGVREDFVATAEWRGDAHDESFASQVEDGELALFERERAAARRVGCELDVAALGHLRKLFVARAGREDAQEVNDGDSETPARVPFVHARDEVERDRAHLRPLEAVEERHAWPPSS